MSSRSSNADSHRARISELKAKIATVFELNPHSDYARSRYSLFTAAECQVVAEFLELMIASPEHADAALARSALDGFWAEAASGAA